MPVTDEGRDALIALIARYRATGQTRELGICLSRLAHCVKHVGTASPEGAFDASARLGNEAIALLRQTHDKKELARALRVAAVPLVDGIDHSALLTESLAIAREIGDKEQEGWTLYRMTRFNGVPGATLEQALACFESCGCVSGKATCLLSLGFGSSPRSLAMIDEAVELYESVGEADSANIARKFADCARSMLE